MASWRSVVTTDLCQEPDRGSSPAMLPPIHALPIARCQTIRPSEEKCEPPSAELLNRSGERIFQPCGAPTPTRGCLKGVRDAVHGTGVQLFTQHSEGMVGWRPAADTEGPKVGAVARDRDRPARTDLRGSIDGAEGGWQKAGLK